MEGSPVGSSPVPSPLLPQSPGHSSPGLLPPAPWTPPGSMGPWHQSSSLYPCISHPAIPHSPCLSLCSTVCCLSPHVCFSSVSFSSWEGQKVLLGLNWCLLLNELQKELLIFQFLIFLSELVATSQENGIWKRGKYFFLIPSLTCVETEGIYAFMQMMDEWQLYPNSCFCDIKDFSNILNL